MRGANHVAGALCELALAGVVILFSPAAMQSAVLDAEQRDPAPSGKPPAMADRRAVFGKPHRNRIGADYGVVNRHAEPRKLIELRGCCRQVGVVTASE